MKIGFLSPNGMFLPYVWGTLRAYVESNISIVNSFKFLNPVTSFSISKNEINSLANCDILLASNYVWNHLTILAAVQEIKKINPRVLTIFGGPQVPNNSLKYFQDNMCIDVAVHGEGEKTLLRLLERVLHAAGNFDDIPNITYREGLRIIQSNRLNDNLELSFASPFLMGYFDELIDEKKNKKFPFLALWETNRGCPFTCSFCDWGSLTMSKVRKFPIEKIREEIKYFSDRKIDDLFVCDANFGMLERDIEISDHLVAAKQMTGFPSAIRVSYAKNSPDHVFEISKKFSDNKMLWGTTLSMQSLNSETLKNIKRQNIMPKHYRTLADKYKKNKIHFYTELIFPLPGETFNSFLNGIEQMLNQGNHSELRIFELSLLPNAKLNQDREQYSFKTIHRPLVARDGALAVDTVEVVVGTDTVTEEDWINGFTFSELIIILHNGGYLQFMSRYLNREHDVQYCNFYLELIENFKKNKEAVLGRIICEINKTLREYLRRSDIPQKSKLIYSTEITNFLNQFGSRNSWFLLHFGWLFISENISRFYVEIESYVKNKYQLQENAELDELLRFQSGIILSNDYDPSVGKKGVYRYDWQDYFVNDNELRAENLTLLYDDIGFGPDFRYEPKPFDKVSFANCAVGASYPESKLNHFMHNLANAKKIINS